MVEQRHGPGQQERDRKDARTAHYLECPDGIQKGVIITTGTLNHAGRKADVGEQTDSDDERGDHSH